MATKISICSDMTGPGDVSVGTLAGNNRIPSACSPSTPITAFSSAEDDASATSIAAVQANHKPYIST